MSRKRVAFVLVIQLAPGVILIAVWIICGPSCRRGFLMFRERTAVRIVGAGGSTSVFRALEHSACDTVLTSPAMPLAERSQQGQTIVSPHYVAY